MYFAINNSSCIFYLFTQVQVAIRKFIRIRVLGNSRHTILTKKSIPISALDDGSFYPDVAEYADVSYSHTVNIINPIPLLNPNDGITYISEKTVCSNNNNKNTYLSSNTKKSQSKKMPKTTKTMSKPAAYSSQSVGEVLYPRPLIIRSYSIGILKEHEFQQKASQQRHDILEHHNHHPLNSCIVSENRQLLHHQRNLSYCANENDCM